MIQMKSLKLIFTVGVLSFFIGSTTGQTVDHCGHTYETVQLNGRTWLKTNIKVPKGGFAAMTQCCGDLEHVNDVKRNGNGKSAFTYSNFDYANRETNPNPWFKKPYVSAFNNDPNDKHGAIFNYYAVEKCNVCPGGFRLPTADEFQEMNNAENLMKRPNRAAEDWGSIGRIDGYGSVVRGRFGEYWTSTQSAEEYKAKAFVLKPNTAEISSEDKRTGCYVRCIKEVQSSAALSKNLFEMLAHSIHGGKDKGSWFLGVDKEEANKAVRSNGQIRVRIVKRIPGVGIKTIQGKDGQIIDLRPMDEQNHDFGGHLYVFNAGGIGDGDYYIATGQNGDKNIYLRHKSTGSEATAKEFAFRSNDAFTKDGTAGEFRSFESYAHPGHYLRHTGYMVLLATKNLGDKVWRGDVSWKITDPK